LAAHFFLTIPIKYLLQKQTDSEWIFDTQQLNHIVTWSSWLLLWWSHREKYPFHALPYFTRESPSMFEQIWNTFCQQRLFHSHQYQ